MTERFQGNTVIVACVRAADPFIQTLKLFLQQNMWHPKLVERHSSLLTDAADPDTALVILDASFPAALNALVELRNRPATRDTPVLRIIDSKTESKESQGFRLAADATVLQPCEVSDVFRAASQVLKEAQGRLNTGESVFRCVLPGDSRWIDESCEEVSKRTVDAGLSDGDQVKFVTALREALMGSVRYASGQAAGTAPEVTVACTLMPGVAAIEVVAPSGSRPWAATQAGGSPDRWDSARAFTLDMIRRCSDEVTVTKWGDGVRFSRKTSR